ncbi:fibulin-1-like [Actinia tenebrosa]|uniref:Fibulin-1-like n=1 Tax=Actinia tenebrosa TaxID=6105 RepID=A0A6P8IBI9_ACTTE|nr:fibulin-1-like [Actinia tenebrosa]
MVRLEVVIALMFLTLVFGGFVTSDLVEDEDASLNEELKGPKDDNLAKKFKWRRCRRQSDCGAGYFCRWYWCYPKRSCSGHMHCDLNSYCDTRDRVCKPGKRRCRSHRHCRSSYLYCKNNQCERKQCFRHYQCPSGQICQRPGVCVNYVQTCKRHRDCKVSGYICINDLCKKRQCYRDNECQFGHQCVTPGLCQLRQGYCLDKSNCPSNQCCLKRWNNVKVGMCTYLQRPGHWCDVQEKFSCPCVEGHTCRKNWIWGTCVYAPTTSPPRPTTVEPTEEPGSGSGDFEV